MTRGAAKGTVLLAARARRTVPLAARANRTVPLAARARRTVPLAARARRTVPLAAYFAVMVTTASSHSSALNRTVMVPTSSPDLTAAMTRPS